MADRKQGQRSRGQGRYPQLLPGGRDQRQATCQHQRLTALPPQQRPRKHLHNPVPATSPKGACHQNQLSHPNLSETHAKQHAVH